jgi:hypothetical protein
MPFASAAARRCFFSKNLSPHHLGMYAFLVMFRVAVLYFRP